MDTTQNLDEFLASIPETPHAFAEHEIRSKIEAIGRPYTEHEEEPSPELSAELAALAFVEDYPQDHWGTYYGPMFVLPNDQGQMVEYPSINALTEPMIQYWQKRAHEATHPCLRLRYADLVWDLSESVCGKKPDYRIASIVIDATIETAKRQLHKHDVFTIKKLRRALDLALSLNDKNRIAEVRDAIIEFEDAITQDDLPGTWGFAFETLLGNKRIPITDKQVRHIIESLESRLIRLHDRPSPGTIEITAAESAALKLERYYQSNQNSTYAHHAIRTYADIVEAAASALEPLVAHHWLCHLFSLLSSKGMGEEAAALTEQIRSTNESTVQNLKQIPHEISISKDELEAYYDSFNKGSLEDALTRVAGHFVPDLEQIVQPVKNLAEKAPLQALIAHTILDHEGRAVAQIGSVESDLEGRAIRQISQNLQIEAFFLRGVIDSVFSHFRPQADDLVQYLSRSPIFETEMKPALHAGLSTYLDEDHISSICVLIPQIEATIRSLAKLIGAPLYRVGRHGGLVLRTLDNLLRDEAISETLDSRVASYFRILLTDQRGWNLRNNVCHGLVPPNMLGRGQADRVLHVLLLLSMLEARDAPPN